MRRSKALLDEPSLAEEEDRVVSLTPDQADALLIIAVLFLLVCSVTLIGILLGKFLARSPEVGLRRALGASRRGTGVELGRGVPRRHSRVLLRRCARY